jgi:hypothetical protein
MGRQLEVITLDAVFTRMNRFRSLIGAQGSKIERWGAEWVHNAIIEVPLDRDRKGLLHQAVPYFGYGSKEEELRYATIRFTPNDHELTVQLTDNKKGFFSKEVTIPLSEQITNIDNPTFVYTPHRVPDGIELHSFAGKAVGHTLYMPSLNDPSNDGPFCGVLPYKTVEVPVLDCPEDLFGTLLLAAVPFSRKEMQERVVNRPYGVMYSTHWVGLESLERYGLLRARYKRPVNNRIGKKVLVGHNTKWQLRILGRKGLTEDDQWMQYHLVNHYPQGDPRRDKKFRDLVLQGGGNDRPVITYNGNKYWLVLKSPLTKPIPKDKIFAEEWYTF